jgi:hypothetical protein
MQGTLMHGLVGKGLLMHGGERGGEKEILWPLRLVMECSCTQHTLHNTPQTPARLGIPAAPHLPPADVRPVERVCSGGMCDALHYAPLRKKNGGIPFELCLVSIVFCSPSPKTGNTRMLHIPEHPSLRGKWH